MAPDFRGMACSWIQPDDRVLITGASGWFGRTLSWSIHEKVPKLLLASPGNNKHACWSPELVSDFKPTVVANFAFHTRDKISKLGVRRYEDENLELINQMAYSMQLPTVRLGVTVSSGAVKDREFGREPDLYSELKLIEENRALDLESRNKKIVVARAFSVSGPFVSRVSEYAFSDLVNQAIQGRIFIKSKHNVVRRFVSVADLLEVCFQIGGEKSVVIESGGVLYELQELADLVRALVNPTAEIVTSRETKNKPIDFYASDNSSWMKAINYLGFQAMTIEEQILEVEKYLKHLAFLDSLGQATKWTNSNL